MKFFDPSKLYYYAFAISLITISAYVGNRFNDAFRSHDEYDLIKNYLLNDSPLYGFNRPKIWIHTKYEYNARKWKSFQSRSSYDLNQPYIHLTIKSIIDHCGDDFHICLIDDNTFSKLIPSWEIDLATVAEPMKTQLRQVGMAELLYYYGGLVLPNSFLCMKNLSNFYKTAISGDKPFVCERVNNSLNLMKQAQRYTFLPDMYIMGAPKNHDTIKELVVYLKARSQTPHFSSDRDFLGDTSQWCSEAISANKLNLVGGELVGVKTAHRQAVLVDHLMEEESLDLVSNAVGIYIPEDELLSRKKYQWFPVLPTEDLLKTTTSITRYLKAALLDNSDHFYGNPPSEQKSVMSI